MIRAALFVVLVCFLTQTSIHADDLEDDPYAVSTDGIVTLELFNASTMTKIATLVSGSVIGVDSLVPSFNILATFAGNVTDVVHFGFNDVANYHSDSSAPFTLCESHGNDFDHCSELGYGSHSVSVTPYNMGGEPLQSISIIFTIIQSMTQKAESSRLLQLSTRQCNVPKSIFCLESFGKLVGTWQRGTNYPLSVAEAQGAMIGSTFLLVSGFQDGFNATTRHTYSLDTSNRSAVWMRQDDVPIRRGVTHAASVVVGAKFYMCGGYRGGSPGPHTNRCFVFDMSKPIGMQWMSFASLPGGGRGGGGMVYDSTVDALLFSGGAQRPSANPTTGMTIDSNSTWMYSLHTPNARWTTKAPIPYLGNHISFVTTTDITGYDRHYFVGGQGTENEANGNKHDHFEYHVPTDKWIRRASMPIARGHASSSTRSIGCGYLIAGGATNDKHKLSDVSYYHVPTNTWTSIGSLPNSINTPVCDVGGGWLYCETGLAKGKFSHKIQISM